MGAYEDRRLPRRPPIAVVRRLGGASRASKRGVTRVGSSANRHTPTNNLLEFEDEDGWLLVGNLPPLCARSQRGPNDEAVGTERFSEDTRSLPAVPKSVQTQKLDSLGSASRTDAISRMDRTTDGHNRNLDVKAPASDCATHCLVEDGWVLLNAQVHRESRTAKKNVVISNSLADTQSVESHVDGSLPRTDVDDDTLALSARGDWTIVEQTPPEEDFVHVPQTPASIARRYAQHMTQAADLRPRVASVLLWTWLVMLVLGELATTIWWLLSLGPQGPLFLAAPIGLGFSLALAALTRRQAASFMLSILLAAMPAVPAYSAVLLIMPNGSGPSSGNPWEFVHWPTLAALGMIHLTSVIIPVLRAEHPAANKLVRTALEASTTARQMARSICVVAAWLYAATLLHMAAMRVSSPIVSNLEENSQRISPVAFLWATNGPFAGSRGLALCLHSLGLLCAEGRRRTVKALGTQLLPRLLGADTARKLTPRALVARHGRSFLRWIPALRDFSLPPGATALVVAVRRTAPVLVPILAVLLQMSNPGWPRTVLLMSAVVIAIVILAMAVAREWRRLPRSRLRRLPLLFPSGVACKRIGPDWTRFFVGHGLVGAARAEGFCRRVARAYDWCNFWEPGKEPTQRSSSRSSLTARADGSGLTHPS